MTTQALPHPENRTNRASTNSNSSTSNAAGFDLNPLQRAAIAILASAMTAAMAYALLRLALGLAPDHPNLREIAIVIHVSTVIPAIPLGAYLLLARKDTARHKQLGKLWIGLMVATALSALFIQTGGSFSWLHIFVPITLHAAWKTVATARKGDMKGHRSAILGLYVGALMIPGVVALLAPYRLMNVLVFGW